MKKTFEIEYNQTVNRQRIARFEVEVLPKPGFESEELPEIYVRSGELSLDGVNADKFTLKIIEETDIETDGEVNTVSENWRSTYINLGED